MSVTLQFHPTKKLIALYCHSIVSQAKTWASPQVSVSYFYLISNPGTNPVNFTSEIYAESDALFFACFHPNPNLYSLDCSTAIAAELSGFPRGSFTSLMCSAHVTSFHKGSQLTSMMKFFMLLSFSRLISDKYNSSFMLLQQNA
jgi:hypothetical protein